MKAKRGDLCAVVRTSHDYVIGEGSKERTSVSLAVVASVTREGVIKAVFPIHGAEGPSDCKYGLLMREQTLAVPAASIDVAGAIAAYCSRRWPSAPHSTSVPPLDSVEDLRELLRPFLIERAA